MFWETFARHLENSKYCTCFFALGIVRRLRVAGDRGEGNLVGAIKNHGKMFWQLKSNIYFCTPF